MKKISKIWTICFGALLMTQTLIAQESMPVDPILKFKNFYEIGLGINATRVNTNHTEFNTSRGPYNFQKNSYLPNLDASLNYGWLFHQEDGSTTWTLKTGLNVLSRSADLTNSEGANLRLYTSYMQIPIQIGFRSPLKYNTFKNNLYRAFEFNAGVYVALPSLQKLDDPNNVDTRAATIPPNYLKFGLISEVLFTALDSKGHGHKFGIRVSSDFTAMAKFADTPNELYPYYYSIGIFYNIMNKYK